MTQTLRRSGSDIKSAVADELGWTPSVDSTHVGVAVDGGAVTLSGEVGSYPEKLMAGKAAQRVHGVTAIAQEITVRSRLDEVNDSDIAREVGEALERAVDVPDSVKALVRGHVVTLTGDVGRDAALTAAARPAVGREASFDGLGFGRRVASPAGPRRPVYLLRHPEAATVLGSDGRGLRTPSEPGSQTERQSVSSEDRDMSDHAAATGPPQTLEDPLGGQVAVLAAWCSCEAPSSPPPVGEILVRRVTGLAVCRHVVHL